MVQPQIKGYDDLRTSQISSAALSVPDQPIRSAIPRVNQPSLEWLKQLNTEWTALKARANENLHKMFLAFNKRCGFGLGAIWKD